MCISSWSRLILPDHTRIAWPDLSLKRRNIATTIVEATTGGSIGSPLHIFERSRAISFGIEKLRTMSAFGAKVELVHSPSGTITPDLIPSMVRRAKKIADGDDHYLANQFNNPDGLVGYKAIDHELIQQFPNGIDAFCGTVGGASMAVGVSTVLKKQYPDTRAVVLEPGSSPVITQGHAGDHGVEGIGIGFTPLHLDSSLYDEVHATSEDEGRQMCRRLAREKGLLVGTSTVLNVVAALALAKKLGAGKTVVTVAVDTGLKYMNGNLFNENY